VFRDQEIYRQSIVWGRAFARRQGFFWRAFVCWLIGMSILVNSQLSTLDWRLQFRGNQKKSEKIVLVTIQINDIHSRSLLEQQAVDITDTYYWHSDTWSKVLAKILASQPKKVGVTLVFGESLAPLDLTAEQKKIFYDSRVVWAGVVAPNDRPIVPIFARYNNQNVGSIEILRDEDGLVRRFTSGGREFDPMFEKLSGKRIAQEGSHLINYRGDSRVFEEYTFTEILTGQVSAAQLKDKIILIGSEPARSVQYLTPLGVSTRHTVLAHMTDNLVEDRLITRASTPIYSVILVLILTLTILILTNYPQSIAFIFIVWLGTLWAALSAWFFDIWFFWLPVSSAVVLMGSTYIIFLGYQANKIERKHFRLKQEQKYLQELEQLKNNFVSLISHDLKTPIAKIQAVLHRLQLEEHSAALKQDLKLLNESSEELGRYIQSIIRMLRVESRDFKLHIEVGDINEIIESVVVQLEPLAKEKKILIKKQLEPMFSSEFDHTLLREVMVNLVENAIKYTPPGGTVTIRSHESENRVYVDVIDTGEGIPEAEISQVWGKFVRGKDQDLKTKGTGLGLYLVKFFIELHGGRVALASSRGKGTTATFSLPTAQKEET
jgi:two-component system, OmpR family, phosphate regulon sensor histidine kinase PhoR